VSTPKIDLRERFEAKVSVDVASGCWNWTGARHMRTGYGSIRVYIDGVAKSDSAHRVAHQLFKGPIPDGLQIDHLCRNRRCVNPDHLEAVTCRVNILRGTSFQAINAAKTECIRGHAFDATNTYIYAAGKRYCRECRRVAWRRWDARRKQPGYVPTQVRRLVAAIPHIV